ncbi:MAG: ABC transporter substrate-binding protein [Erysipelotrichaceae bacterium]
MKTIFKRLGVSCLALAMLVGCGGPKKDDSKIQIGLNYEQSGGVAQYGIAHIEGIEMAIEEINAAGGINGKQVELLKIDNKSDTKEVKSVAQRLADQGAVMILGPSTSGNTMAAYSQAKITKIPTISASATQDSATLEADGSTTAYGFKTCFNDSFQGQALANFATEKGFKKVAVIYDSASDYANGVKTAFAGKYTGEVVATEAYAKDEKDFNSILTKIKNKGFDAIVVAGYYEQAGLLVKQARESGINAPILGTDGFDDSKFVDLAGAKNLDNIYYTTHFSSLDKDEKVATFIEKFNTKYKKAPGAFAALGYDLAYYAKDVIERANSTEPDKLVAALEDTKSFKGVTGEFSMDKNHVAKKQIKVVQLTQGKQTTVETINY